MSKKLKLLLMGGIFYVFSLLSIGQINSLWGEKSERVNPYMVRYVAEFSLSDLSFDKQMGYEQVTLKDGDCLSEPGKPMLPMKEIKIALPIGMAAKSVRVVDTKSMRISGEYNIFPVQPLRRADLSDRDVDFMEPEKEIYSSNQPYPSKLVEFVHQTDLAGQGIAVIQLYPLQYVPSEKRLTLYTSITLVIDGVGGYECRDYLSPNISEKGRRIYEKMVKDMVVNPQDVQLQIGFKTGKSTLLPSGHFEHVIITSSSYAPSFAPLVSWHTRKGIKDTVITTAWIYANYAGADTQKIRAFIVDAYNSWGTLYFLLGGENNDVPFAYRTYYENESTPSDQYYSDYDDDTTTQELFVGRASVGNSSECTTFVNKVLKYEKDPPRSNYLLNVLLIGMDMDAQTHMEYLKDTIAAHIPPRFNITKVYDSHTGNHRTAVVNALNAGQHLVNHADHGNYNILATGYYNHGWYIQTPDVDALTNNDRMSVVVAPLSCLVNEMDYSIDCIGEHFVIYNPYEAGLAFIGCTRSAYYAPGYPPGSCGKLDKEWWLSLFDRSYYDLGQILVSAKHNFSTTSPGYMHDEWTLNLLGEPEMPVWTDDPDSFFVTHPSTLSPESTSFLVHVEDFATHSPVESAYVCLWKGNGVYLTGYTNVSGEVTFTPSPNTIGIMYVTVTNHNYIPYEGEANVIFAPPVVRTDSASNVEENSSTLYGYLERAGGLQTTCWFLWDTDSGEPYAFSASVGVVTGGSEFTKELTGLAEGELYYFSTKAQNSEGDSSGGELKFLTKPLPPTDLTAQGISDSAIYLSWNKPASADKTIIERNSAPTWARTEGEEIYNGTDTNHEDSGLTPCSHHYYQAWSYCTEEGLEQYSDDYDSADATTLHFAPAVSYATGNQPYSIFCANLDTAQGLDLAVANIGSNSVSILMNYGDGTFYLDSNYTVGSATSVFCADLDGDGDLDLAVANSASDSVSILKNKGDGTFETAVNYGTGDGPWSVFCADLDGDDDLDLAVANNISDNVSILKNNDDATFQDTVNYGVGDDPISVFCADLDGDGDLDLAVANFVSNNVSILKNNGDGTFQPKVDYVAGIGPRSVFCADLDGDLDLDLAVTNEGSDDVSILKNDGDGTFQPKVDYGAGDSCISVFCADLDGDVDLDLAVVNGTHNVSILKNNGDGTFQTKVDYGAGDNPQSVFCADLDDDGDFDLAVANRYSDNVSILKNLCQIPANQAPRAFHLLFPLDEHTTSSVVNFDWQTAYDPNLGDQIRYDLYVSTTPNFDPLNTTIDSNLLVSTHTETFDIGIYYWKVKARDNWGAFRWSRETWRFFNNYYLTDTLTVVAFGDSAPSPVDLIVTDPLGDSISLWFNTIQNATYDTTDYDADGYADDVVTMPDRLAGDYQIRVVADPGGGGGVYSLGIRIDGTSVLMLSTNHPCPSPGEVDTFFYYVPWYKSGDASGDWVVNSADICYLVNYLFVNGPAPQPQAAGDVNWDGTINIADVVYLINYLFTNGPPPACK
jgi:hypothetical protein